MTMIKAVIADDQALLRGGLRAMLEATDDITVVGEAADGAEAVEVALATHPDVVLMDVRMPKLDGIEATRRLAAAGSRARVLVVTTFDLDEYVLQALRAGAGGFLLKATPPDRLADAVRTVAAGESLLDPSVTHRLIERFLGAPEADPDVQRRLGELTDRELHVLRLLARGLSNAEVGRELFISEATAKSHVTRLLGKLGVRSRVQAVVLAYEAGVVRPGDHGLDR
ncbi:MAG TPA: response regulator transcription factor [Capillimicrobium sp.]|nr:response regulator transcription factor [Capillimicrobium sp.]